MRIRLYACLVLVVIATPLCAQAAPDSVQAAAATILWGAPSSSENHGDIQRVAISGELFMERLAGQAALTHLYNLMSRRPEAFRTAREALKARGFQPTDTVYVERTIRLAKGPSRGDGSIMLAQDHSESNSDGEIVFWSWDDGNDSTWEGDIYVENYSTGRASSWEGQIDASTEEHPWIYYRKTWEGGAGGGPLPTSLESMPPRPGDFARAVPAIMSLQPGLPGNEYAPAGAADWARCWRQCVVTGCGTAAVGCLGSGPLWPKCFSLWCIGAEIFCAIGCAM